MPQRYRVTGRNRESGQKIEVVVRADSVEKATAAATNSEFDIESVVLEKTSSISSPPTTPPFPERSPTRKNSKRIELSNPKSLVIAGGLAILLAGIAYPLIPLLFGLGILICCFGVLTPQIRDMSKRFFNIDLALGWKTGLYIATFGIVGISFVYFAWSSFATKAEEREIVARQAEAEAQTQRLVEEANGRVAIVASEAEGLWKNGNKEMAIAKLEEAEHIPNATIFTPVRTLRRAIANADVSAIMSEAISAAESGNLDAASAKIESALAVENATDREAANQLKEIIGLTQNSEVLHAYLLKLSDEELAGLQEGSMFVVSGYAGLDERLEELVHKELPSVLAAKEEQRKKEEAERLLQEEVAAFVESGVGKKVPYDKWEIFGNPTTLDGTDNRYWAAYLDKAKVSFVSEKSSDEVIFVQYGKKSASEFLARKAKMRKEQLERQFSGWDGSHKELTSLIKASMNDPGSYKHVETVYWDKGDHLIVRTKFRGKNAFGGIVLNWVKAKVDLDGNVLEIIEEG